MNPGIFGRIFVALALALSAGIPTPGFAANPQALLGTEQLAPDMAVVLVGVTGPGQMNYMQFTHASFPSLNLRFDPRGDSIVAFAVPVGTRKLSLSSYTLKGRRAGYAGGMSFGYIPVHSATIDIDAPGIYFLATVDTSDALRYSAQPLPEQLREVRLRLEKTLDGRATVNFAWP